MEIVVIHTATDCNRLQHTTTYCNILQHTATHCRTLQNAATLTCHQGHGDSSYRFVPHPATPCHTLQHPATPCNTLQHSFVVGPMKIALKESCHTIETPCSTMQHTPTYCNALQHTATHCNALQRIATHGNALQHTALHCNVLHQKPVGAMKIVVIDACHVLHKIRSALFCAQVWSICQKRPKPFKRNLQKRHTKEIYKSDYKGDPLR